MSYVSSLKLRNFRCYEQAALAGLGPGLVVLHGPNGAGKTNVLEALSVLSPGRGLRGVRATEMQCKARGESWAVSAQVQNGYGDIRLGTGLDPHTEKRIVRINGETAKSQGALSDHIACVWLTPQMDRLFLDSPRERRRFFDRLVFAFDPGHSGRVTRYENALAQRSKLLKEGHADPVWLTALEAQMAETGIAIAAARLDFMHRLQAACRAAGSDHFPLAHLRVTGAIEEILQNTSALETEELFAYQLAESRGVDMLTGGAATGPHKSDMAVTYAAKNMPADQCSTGEQKALLIGIVLAHARLIAGERGAPPVLLLDEIAAHLDEARRAALYDVLSALGGQAWLTGTDESLFDAVRGRAQFFEIINATINHQHRLARRA
jgi:DNA replication and repair protein RecF